MWHHSFKAQAVIAALVLPAGSRPIGERVRCTMDQWGRRNDVIPVNTEQLMVHAGCGKQSDANRRGVKTVQWELCEESNLSLSLVFRNLVLRVYIKGKIMEFHLYTTECLKCVGKDFKYGWKCTYRSLRGHWLKVFGAEKRRSFGAALIMVLLIR